MPDRNWQTTRQREVVIMNDDKAGRNLYECVEPDVGRELWRWAAPGATDEERAHRADHLRVCDACRLEHAVERTVAAGLTDGTLRLPVPAAHTPRRRLVPTLAAGAVGMAAMGLLLVMLLPPSPPPGFGTDRSGSSEGFIRPVEGETVGASGPNLRWHPLPGANSYRVRVEEVAGDFSWSGETHDTDIALPTDASLTAGREYRAYVEPVPRDLAPAGGLSVRFRSGSLASVLRYRAAAAPASARWLTLSGALMGLGAVVIAALGRFRGPTGSA